MILEFFVCMLNLTISELKSIAKGRNVFKNNQKI